MAKEQPLPAKAAKAQALDDLIMGVSIHLATYAGSYSPKRNHFVL